MVLTLGMGVGPRMIGADTIPIREPTCIAAVLSIKSKGTLDVYLDETICISTGYKFNTCRAPHLYAYVRLWCLMCASWRNP